MSLEKIKVLINQEVKKQLNAEVLKAVTPLIKEIQQLKKANKMLAEHLMSNKTMKSKAKSLAEASEEELDAIIARRLAEDRTTPAPVKQQSKTLYSNNPLLNDMLNETAANMKKSANDYDPHNYSGYETMDKRKMAAMLGYGNMPGQGQYDMSGFMPVDKRGPSVDEMLPEKDVRGLPSKVSANQVPEFLKKALTRNYSELVKVMDKDIKKRGLGGSGNTYSE